MRITTRTLVLLVVLALAVATAVLLGHSTVEILD
jgi:hypothetical protein